MRILANRILPRAFGAALIVSLVTGFTPTIVLPATTGPSGLPIPRFASLGSDRVNLRKGPGPQYPIVWVYKRRGMPMEIVAEYNLWRQVRDHDNTEGWVQKNLLSGRRTGMVTGGVRNLRRDPEADAAPVALLEPGVIGEVKKCNGDWCVFRTKDYEGWLRRDEMWGVLPDEPLE